MISIPLVLEIQDRGNHVRRTKDTLGGPKRRARCLKMAVKVEIYVTFAHFAFFVHARSDDLN